MKSKFLFSVILVVGFMLANLSVNQVYGQTPKDKTIKQQTVKYTCPDHQDVVKEHPGNCPKCGMKMTEKKGMSTGVSIQMKDSTMMKQDRTKTTKDTLAPK